MSSCFVLKLEIKTGCKLDAIAKEIAEIATRIGVSVRSDFNGDSIYANPGWSENEVLRLYNDKKTEQEMV
jgi:hypothetical protein